MVNYACGFRNGEIFSMNNNRPYERSSALLWNALGVNKNTKQV